MKKEPHLLSNLPIQSIGNRIGLIANTTSNTRKSNNFQGIFPSRDNAPIRFHGASCQSGDGLVSCACLPGQKCKSLALDCVCEDASSKLMSAFQILQ